MKVYRLSWSVEDDYGPMGGVYLIIQAEDEAQSIEFATTYLKESTSTTIEELAHMYGEVKIEDVTKYQVLECRSFGMI